MADVDAKDLQDRLDSYHHEIVELARETTSSVATLKEAIEIVNESKTSFWVRHRNVISIAIALGSVLLFIVGVTVTMKLTQTCVVNIKGQTDSIFKACPEGNESVKETLQKTN